MRLMVRWMYGVLVLAWAMCVLAGCNMDLRVPRRDAAEDASDDGSPRDAHRTTDAGRAIPEGDEIVVLPDSCDGECPAVHPAYARVGFVQRGGETLMVGFLVDDKFVFVHGRFPLYGSVGALDRHNAERQPFYFKLFRSSRVVRVVSIKRASDWAMLTLAERAAPDPQPQGWVRTNYYREPRYPVFNGSALSISHGMSADGTALVLRARRCRATVVRHEIKADLDCLTPGGVITVPTPDESNVRLLGFTSGDFPVDNAFQTIGPSFDYIQDMPRSVVDLAVTSDGNLMVVVDEQGQIIQRRRRQGAYDSWEQLTAQQNVIVQGHIEHVTLVPSGFAGPGRIGVTMPRPQILAQASAEYSPGCNTYWFDVNPEPIYPSGMEPISGGRWCAPGRPGFVPIDVVTCANERDVAILSEGGDIMMSSSQRGSSQWSTFRRRTDEPGRADAIACATVYRGAETGYRAINAILAHMTPSNRLIFYLREEGTEDYALWGSYETSYSRLISVNRSGAMPSWVGLRADWCSFYISPVWREGPLVPSRPFDDPMFGFASCGGTMATVAMDGEWRVVEISREEWRAKEVMLRFGLSLSTSNEVPW